MGNAVSMERLNCRRGQPGDIGELHAIFDMNRSHAARLQSPQQLRGEEVHLLEELIIVRVVPEVIVAGAVLIVVTERNRGHIQVDAVRRPALDLFHAIVIDCDVVAAFYFHALTSYRSL